jgi:transcriptional regulator with XRE-family HTH domain
MTFDFISEIRRRTRMGDRVVDQGEDRSAAFDADAFYETLDGERRTRGLNWKEVAAAAKVSPSTLTRLGQGRRPDVDSFARLVAWGGFAADQFVTTPRLQAAGGFLTNLPTYLRSDPNLDDKGVQALETIIRAAYDQFRR